MIPASLAHQPGGVVSDWPDGIFEPQRHKEKSLLDSLALSLFAFFVPSCLCG
jgi:hypothetical protein